jgi:hypothetical protein
MKNQRPLFALVACIILSVIGLHPSTVRAQGSLTPSGPPTATMKSLAQIEPRTPISSAPFVITNSGSYYLTTNLSVTTSNAIMILTNGVTLDLGGFTITSTASSPNGSGIFLGGSIISGIAIFNGHIRGGVTNSAGTYSGTGFAYGISGTGSLLAARISGVSVSGCLYHGIYIGNGISTVVESCTVAMVGSYGIAASTIRGSTAMICGDTAIAGDQVSDCRGESNIGYGISADTAQNCYGVSSTSYGVYAITANNCYGSCGGNSIGLWARSANNCYGWSSSLYGVYVTVANNCYGDSYSGYGVVANIANNCYGHSTGGTGLLGNQIATSCYGSSTNGKGLSALIAVSSFGQSSSNTGLTATIANSCSGSSSSGTAVSVTSKYNMP